MDGERRGNFHYNKACTVNPIGALEDQNENI